MPDEGFRLPVSSYEGLAQIIKAYGSAKEAIGPEQLSKLATKNPTEISGDNAFLVAIGIVEGNKKKAPTERGRALARALEHEMPAEIETHWREIVLANEFLQQLVSAVRIRKSMEASNLQAHVAYSAGQSKTQKVMTGARAVVDILRAAGLLREEDGSLMAVHAGSDGPRETSVQSPTSVEHPAGSAIPTAVGTVPVKAIGRTGIGIVIQINVNCSADEVSTLAPKLRELLKELSYAEAVENIEAGE
jgi:hypothetical protein